MKKNTNKPARRGEPVEEPESWASRWWMAATRAAGTLAASGVLEVLRHLRWQ